MYVEEADHSRQSSQPSNSPEIACSSDHYCCQALVAFREVSCKHISIWTPGNKYVHVNLLCFIEKFTAPNAEIIGLKQKKIHKTRENNIIQMQTAHLSVHKKEK